MASADPMSVCGRENFHRRTGNGTCFFVAEVVSEKVVTKVVELDKVISPASFAAVSPLTMNDVSTEEGMASMGVAEL